MNARLCFRKFFEFLRLTGFNLKSYGTMVFCMKFRIVIAAATLISSLSWGTEKKSETMAVRDAKEYIVTIEKVSKLKIEDQIDVWQTFLSDHPKQTFRKEIEHNIDLLQSLSQKKAVGKQGDERDAELYLKALEFSKKLSLNDQILLWEQFLNENPTSIYRTEAQSRLSRLKRYKAKTYPGSALPAQPIQQKSTVPTAQPQSTPTPPAVNSLSGISKDFKDEDQAMLLAGLAGLVVPGMGHWYTEDYVVAGVLSAMRIAGLAIGIPGIINSNYNQIYVGGGIAVLSYAVDIADAPYSARRFNEALTSAYFLPEQSAEPTLPLFAYTFKF